MPFPVLAQVLGSLGQAYVAAVAAFDAVQDFIHAGPPGEAAKLSGQELLQGLALALCALLKGGMDVVRKVADEQIRHAYIMQASAAAEQVTAASRHDTDKVLGEQTRAHAANETAHRAPNWMFCESKHCRPSAILARQSRRSGAVYPPVARCWCYCGCRFTVGASSSCRGLGSCTHATTSAP
jgi:hypothetical protein